MFTINILKDSFSIVISKNVNDLKTYLIPVQSLILIYQQTSLFLATFETNFRKINFKFWFLHFDTLGTDYVIKMSGDKT